MKIPAHSAICPDGTGGKTLVTQKGSRRESTTLSSTTLTGHGAARLMAVSTTIAQKTAPRSSRCGRTRDQINRITSVPPPPGRYGRGCGGIGQAPQLRDPLLKGARVGDDLRFRGAAGPQAGLQIADR